MIKYILFVIYISLENICLETVKDNDYSMYYARIQTEDICLEDVKQDVIVLRYVQNQTEKICLAAVKKNGNALLPLISVLHFCFSECWDFSFDYREEHPRLLYVHFL